MAKAAGLQPDRLVFDSPAKTRSEIQQLGIQFPGLHVNADSLHELSRYPKSHSGLKLGLRINPAIESDSIQSMSVGNRQSKFGELLDHREEIMRAFEQWEDLQGLHIHSGSQFKNLDPTIQSISRVIELAEEIESRLGYQKVKTIDIGGGFPINYDEQSAPYSLAAYAAQLKERVPVLFSGKYKVITEFGRWVHAVAGWIVSEVEYVKQEDDFRNVVIHIGADAFLREAYNPADWYHALYVLDPEGHAKPGTDLKPANIAGPLCFGGDFIEKDHLLPPIQPGDKVVIADCGANTFSLWSRHCSRPFPKVIGYIRENGKYLFRILKERETMQDIIRFWS